MELDNAAAGYTSIRKLYLPVSNWQQMKAALGSLQPLPVSAFCLSSSLSNLQFLLPCSLHLSCLHYSSICLLVGVRRSLTPLVTKHLSGDCFLSNPRTCSASLPRTFLFFFLFCTVAPLCFTVITLSLCPIF